MRSFNLKQFAHSILYHAPNVLTEAVKNKIRHLGLVESQSEQAGLWRLYHSEQIDGHWVKRAKRKSGSLIHFLFKMIHCLFKCCGALVRISVSQFLFLLLRLVISHRTAAV
jgi:hypothetical protein